MLMSAPQTLAAPRVEIEPGAVAAAEDGLRTLKYSGLLFIGVVTLMAIEYLGLAYLVPALKAVRAATLLAGLLVVAVLAQVGVKAPFRYRLMRMLGLLIVFTIASVMWAVVRTYAADSITPHLGYLGLGLILIYIIATPKAASRLALCYAIFVIILVVRNLDLLTSGVRVGSFRAGYFMGDGNDFSWGICVFLPFTLYLIIGKHGILTRCVGAVALGASLLAIVGGQSRGATLALAAMVLYFWLLVAKRKALGVAVLAVGVGLVVVLAPPQYLQRMHTVVDYGDDTSATGRIAAWTAATQMAFDYPLGVGASNFNSAYGRFYRTPDGPIRWISAHSTYFKVLAEYGFPGLALWISILGTVYLENHRTRAMIRAHPPASGVPELWPAIVCMSIVGYAVAGLFLGGIMYPHVYMLAGLTLSARRMALSGAAAPGAPVVVSVTTVPASHPTHAWPALGKATRAAARHTSTLPRAGSGGRRQR
jgi:putative inorganic carbon (HCO3(-)) transporter